MASYTLIFRRYAPFDSFGLGFEGDGRSAASTRLDVTARTIGVVVFDEHDVTSISATSSGTEYVAAGQRVREFLGRHTSEVAANVRVIARRSGYLRFRASSAGGNPMLGFLAPNIDTFVEIGVLFFGHELLVNGIVSGDDFPNAEVFLASPGGGAQLLFDFHTTGGRHSGPFTRLAFDHEDNVLGTFWLRVPLRAGGELPPSPF
ncbi:MAG: hypothetical protein KIT17_10430 [Rubrivivax sp.]|nr:hypothetical protein [Rubrivivax sp.]